MFCNPATSNTSLPWTVVDNVNVTNSVCVCVCVCVCVYYTLIASGWWSSTWHTINISCAKFIRDWDIRRRERVCTRSTFLFYFQHQVLRDCRVDFSEWSERPAVCEAVWECVCVRVWMPISCPCECDRHIVFLTRSVRAEWRCSKPCVCVCISLHAYPHSCRVVYVFMSAALFIWP